MRNERSGDHELIAMLSPEHNTQGRFDPSREIVPEILGTTRRDFCGDRRQLDVDPSFTTELLHRHQPQRLVRSIMVNALRRIERLPDDPLLHQPISRPIQPR
jgi:hypothetical protein